MYMECISDKCENRVDVVGAWRAEAHFKTASAGMSLENGWGEEEG